ncbi:hypothetical protein [Kribbella sp. NPDC003557]|uniref:hypothetical protein n=1 Tax=Kribbella sp. NPDC003557 TaxID=3154449 RepID=UPI0033BC7357
MAVLRALMISTPCRPHAGLEMAFADRTSPRQAGQKEARRTAVWPAKARDGCDPLDLLLDEAGKFGWDQNGIVFDGEVGAVVVAVEAVNGQFDESADRQRVKPDQSTGDSCREGKCVVIEAAFPLIVAVLFAEESRRQPGPADGDCDHAGDAARDEPTNDRAGGATQRGMGGEPAVDVGLPEAGQLELFLVQPGREPDCGTDVATVGGRGPGGVAAPVGATTRVQDDTPLALPANGFMVPENQTC